MPIIIRTNGTIPESEQHTWKADIKETEKTAILDSAGKLTFPLASNITGVINCNHRIAANLHTSFQLYNCKCH